MVENQQDEQAIEQARATAPLDSVVSSDDAEHYLVAATFGDGRHHSAIVPGADAGAFVDNLRRAGAAPVVIAWDVIRDALGGLVGQLVADHVDRLLGGAGHDGLGQ
jgi:hypothetical protein